MNNIYENNLKTTSELKKAKSIFYSQNNQQRLNIILNLSSEFFKICMSCMFSIFVPQSCNGNLCSIEENFTNLIPYNSFVVIFNFLTLFCFFYLYWIEIDRESWMINHLDYDEKESEYNLTNFKDSHSDILNRLDKRNKYYLKVYFLLKYIYVLNFLFSAILVLHFYYLDYRTITTLFTNLYLCVYKVFKGYSLAKRSVEQELGISYYNTIFISFNTIDPKYLNQNKKNAVEENILEKNIVKEINSNSECMQVELNEKI